MDGAAIILDLLANDSGLTALVSASDNPSRISGDALGQGVTLPAVRVWKIDGFDRNILSPGAKVRVTQRVQVESHAATIPSMKQVHAAIRAACADQIIASLGGLTEIVVLTQGEGPEGLSPDTMARVATQDFSVSYNEAR